MAHLYKQATAKSQVAADAQLGRLSPNLRSVLLFSPGWPPGTVANGIVSTVATKKHAFESLGVQCSVLAISRHHLMEDRANGVFHVAAFDRWAGKQCLHARIAKKISQFVTTFACANSTASTSSTISGLRAALTFIQRNRPCDLIEIEESFGRSLAVSRHSTVPIVVRLHGPRFLTGAAHGIQPDNEYVARVKSEGQGIINAHGVSSPSKFVLRAVEEHYQSTLRCCAVIPNAVVRVKEDLIWTANLAVSDHILFIGRVDRLKGADVCLQAFVKVLESRPNSHLTVVGPDRGIRDSIGQIRSGPKWIEDEIQTSSVRSRIVLRGQLTRDELVGLRRQSSVVVVPSRFENFPTTVLEAMSQGCPIVASRVGGIPEMIEHECNGLLCEAGDSDDLASKILSLLDNPSYSAGLGNRALQDSIVRYSPNVIAKQELEFYKEVCSRASERGKHLAASIA